MAATRGKAVASASSCRCCGRRTRGCAAEAGSVGAGASVGVVGTPRPGRTAPQRTSRIEPGRAAKKGFKKSVGGSAAPQSKPRCSSALVTSWSALTNAATRSCGQQSGRGRGAWGGGSGWTGLFAREPGVEARSAVTCSPHTGGAVGRRAPPASEPSVEAAAACGRLLPPAAACCLPASHPPGRSSPGGSSRCERMRQSSSGPGGG